MSQNSAYGAGDYSELMSTQHIYESQHALNSPTDYAKIMHEHTKKQLEIATNSARRRSQGYKGDSRAGSVSSTDS
ncbi:hypothetical protein P154DRAFT_624420 [Amniculicola lignicola CBS 123094]|uniref:Uncharacterized protein n=1 Tax=Amniculicola lignicola CBS 123094 TaxID=1392246 RepID=A0A6A5W0Q8_9PLEO|nr:hypothetical protein P154DRAFT_624420 [Amniculicola lignicola CBS 123094]